MINVTSWWASKLMTSHAQWEGLPLVRVNKQRDAGFIQAQFIQSITLGHHVGLQTLSKQHHTVNTGSENRKSTTPASHRDKGENKEDRFHRPEVSQRVMKNASWMFMVYMFVFRRGQF